MRPAVQGNETVPVNLVQIADFIGGNDCFGIINDEYNPLFLGDIHDKVPLKVIKCFYRITGKKLIGRQIRIPGAHGFKVIFLHIGKTEGNSARFVIENDDVAIAEQNLGNIILNLHKHELALVHLVRQKITDISMHKVQIGCF